jgi:hypothetical protein
MLRRAERSAGVAAPAPTAATPAAALDDVAVAAPPLAPAAAAVDEFGP